MVFSMREDGTIMKKKQLYGTIGAGVVLAALLIGLSLRGGNSSNTGKAVDLSAIPVEGKVRGYPEAPVLVEIFSDYQCYWCAQSAKGFEKQVLPKYMADGTIRVQYRDFAFTGIESYWAAVAANCAARQNRFWEYHDRLFAEQRGENQGYFNTKRLLEWAADLELDMTSFTRCFETEEPAAEIVAERRLGDDVLDVNSTPTIFVNGRKFEGIPTEQQFKKLLEDALKDER
jgi:protein-disulfide isomerase